MSVQSSEAVGGPREARDHNAEESRPLPEGLVDATAAPKVVCDQIEPSWLGGRAVVLHDLATASECERLVAFFENCNVTAKCLPRTDYRNNYRVMALGEAAARILFERLRPFLPPVEVIDATNEENYPNRALGMHGKWHILSLNPLFRICKYDPQGHFAPHRDSDFCPELNCRSLKTFMIYLNDTYEDGETQFLAPHDLYFNDAEKRYEAAPGTAKASLKARQGDALIFDHDILHEGRAVKNGYKYIMRCEVMYRRDAVPDEQRTKDDAKYEQALVLFREAQMLEADRKDLEAVEKYRKAIKLWPDLEQRL